MPRLPVSNIDVTLTEVSCGERTPIESTSHESNIREPRVIWNIEDLSSYMESATGPVAPLVSALEVPLGPLSWRDYVVVRATTMEEMESLFDNRAPVVINRGSLVERSTVRELEKEHPGLLTTINNIIESRLIEHGYSFKKRQMPKDGWKEEIKKASGLAIQHALDLDGVAIYATQPSRSILNWIDGVLVEVESGIFRQKYNILPTVEKEKAALFSGNRDLVIFTKAK